MKLKLSVSSIINFRPTLELLSISKYTVSNFNATTYEVCVWESKSVASKIAGAIKRFFGETEDVVDKFRDIYTPFME
jgi:hypothetical protein